MRIQLSVLLGLFAINVFLAIWLPWRDELLLPTCSGLGAGVAIYAAGRIVRRALSRGREHIRQAPPRLRVRDVRSRTAVVVVSFAAVVTGLQFGLSQIISSQVAGEVSYYLSLVLLGAVLAGWAGASEAAAFAIVAGTTLGSVGIQLVMFVSDPAARFQFGPEIWLFAAGNYAGRMALLPVDLGVTLAFWHIVRPYGPVPDRAAPEGGPVSI